MRVFLAGATGLIGVRVLRLLLAEGHQVAAMTRTAAKADGLRAMGAVPVVRDVYDRAGLIADVAAFGPEVVMHQLTDLPDRPADLAAFAPRNARIRTEGTANLLAAAAAAGSSAHIVAQSVAWPAGPVVEAHEAAILAAGGAVLRYGQFYGPGSFYEDALPPDPKVSLEAAAQATMRFLAGPPGVFIIVDPKPAAG